MGDFIVSFLTLIMFIIVLLCVFGISILFFANAFGLTIVNTGYLIAYFVFNTILIVLTSGLNG